jgi:hypothetical protein
MHPSDKGMEQMLYREEKEQRIFSPILFVNVDLIKEKNNYLKVFSLATNFL